MAVGTIHIQQEKGAPLEAWNAMALLAITILNYHSIFSPNMVKNSFIYSDFPLKQFHKTDEGHDWPSILQIGTL